MPRKTVETVLPRKESPLAGTARPPQSPYRYGHSRRDGSRDGRKKKPESLKDWVSCTINVGGEQPRSPLLLRSRCHGPRFGLWKRWRATGTRGLWPSIASTSQTVVHSTDSEGEGESGVALPDVDESKPSLILERLSLLLPAVAASVPPQ